MIITMIGDFFFQAEDGIRDLTVTGVQTCALPISALPLAQQALQQLRGSGQRYEAYANYDVGTALAHTGRCRSEERRVGKESRSRWLPHNLKKKKLNNEKNEG